MAKALKDLGCHDRELSIVFTSDKEIAKLNKQYLNRDGPTNVISFPMDDAPCDKSISPMLGDIVISIDTAKRESNSLGEPLEYTLDRLLIHGLLHLLGFDHETSESDATRMEQEETRLLKILKEA